MITQKVIATANGNKRGKNIAISAAVIAVVAVAVLAFVSSAPACDTDEQPLGAVGDVFNDGVLYYIVTEDGPDRKAEVYAYVWPMLTPDLVIPDSVTYNSNTYSVASIGEDAFIYCDSLTSVTVLGSIASVGERAFRLCTNLSSVTVSGSVTSIGPYAFNNCTKLVSVSMTGSPTTIGPGAFSYCGKLAAIDLSSVVTIGDLAFSNCSELTSVDISSATTIKVSAFLASGLTSVRMPDAVTVMENSIFAYCADLTSVDLNLVEYLGDGSFQGCSKLETIVIPDSVRTIGSMAFMNSGLISVTLPDSVKTVKNAAFQNCFSLLSADLNSIEYLGWSAFLSSGIISIVIPDGIQTIEMMTFYKCGSLTSVTLPSSLTTIERWAFEDCTSLASVTLPVGVTSIGMQAFLGCTKLGALAMPYHLTTPGSLETGAVPAHISRVYYDGALPVTAYREVIGGGAEDSAEIFLTLPSGVTAAFLGQSYGSHEKMASGAGTAWQFTKIAGWTFYYLSTGHAVTVTCGDNGTFGIAVGGDAAWPHYDVSLSEYSIYVPDGSLLELTAVPDTKYYAEWEELGVRSFADPSLTVTADRGLILRFLPLWDVTFDPNGGSAVATQTVADGGYAITPAPPTKFGYAFGGWYSDAALTVPFAFTTPITDDITLYADWYVITDDPYAPSAPTPWIWTALIFFGLFFLAIFLGGDDDDEEKKTK